MISLSLSILSQLRLSHFTSEVVVQGVVVLLSSCLSVKVDDLFIIVVCHDDVPWVRDGGL